MDLELAATRIEIERLKQHEDTLIARLISELDAARVEVERLRNELKRVNIQFDSVSANAVALYRRGALDWNNKSLPPDDNVLLVAGLQAMNNPPSEARDIVWHDALSDIRIELARLRVAATSFAWAVVKFDEDGNPIHDWPANASQAWNNLWAILKPEPEN